MDFNTAFNTIAKDAQEKRQKEVFDEYAATLRSFYLALVKTGFSKSQSLEMVKEFIASVMTQASELAKEDGRNKS